MYVHLCDRSDRLGANITNYIAQILYAYNNKYPIKFLKEKEQYKYYNSFFVKTLLNYIENYNEELKRNIINNHYENDYYIIGQDYITTISNVVKDIKSDFISFFINNIYNNIKSDFYIISSFTINYIPFDINKTILVHLRLDDVAGLPDYDGSFCSNYYKNKIKNNDNCVCEFYGKFNNQAPLSKTKLDNIINKAKNEFTDYKVILITSPISDASFLDYEVINSNDENMDLYFLTMCKVVILSRSTFALSSMFFNDNKIKTYIPLWGHFVCCGLDTIHDKNDISKIEYFV